MPDTPEEIYARIKGSSAPAGGSSPQDIWNRLKAGSGEDPGRIAATGAGLWQGLKDIGASVGELASRVPADPAMGTTPEQRQQNISFADRIRPQMEAAYAQNPAVKAHPNYAMGGRIAGNVAGTAPLMALPGGAGMGMLGRTALGLGQGAVAGGMTGGPSGILPGAAAGAGLGAAGAAIGPVASQAMQAIAQKFPNLAGMATGSMGRSEEAFQRATANEVLFPIGEFVDRSVKVGHSLINEVGEKLNAAYNKLLPKVTFRPAETNPATGRSFNDSLREITDVVPDAFANDFTKLVQRVIEKPVKEGGGLLSGEAFKKAQSAVGQEARQFTKWNADPNQEKYGSVLHDLQASMRESLRAHNPTEAPMLEKVDQAWARYVRLQDASGRRVGGQGEFTPIDLLNAAKRGEGNRAFSEGNRLMQGFGTAGLNLVQGKPTNIQQVLMNVAGAGAGAGVGSMIGGPAGATAGAAAGTAAGQLALPTMRGLGRLSRTDTLRELGAATSRAAPVAGAGLGDEKRRDPYVSSSGL